MIFQWNIKTSKEKASPEEIENLLKSVLLTENTEGLEPSKVGEQSHIKLSQLY